jgi:hypothetical protein
MKFSCTVGAYVKTNETSILSKTGSAWIRKHTGTADQEVIDTIQDQVDNAEAYFQQLKEDKEAMLKVSITKREYAELLGRLLVDVKLIGIDQISIAKREYEKASFSYTSAPDSLWTAYNHILVALTKAHPSKWMEQQKLLHFYMMGEFDFTVFDDEEDEDINQTSLVDMIDEVEDAGVENVSELPVEIPLQEDIDEDNYSVGESEVLSDDDIEEATEEELVGEPELPVTRLMTKREIVEEYGDVLPEEQLRTLGIEVKPEMEATAKPTISMVDAIAKYGHLLSEEERVSLLKSKGPADALQVIRDAYNADQEVVVAEEIPDILLKDPADIAIITTLTNLDGSTPENAVSSQETETTSPVVDLDAEDDAILEQVLTPIENVDSSLKTETTSQDVEDEPSEFIAEAEINLAEQVQNDMVESVMASETTSTLNETVPTILGADSAEEEAKVMEVLQESGLALPPTSMKEVDMDRQQEVEYNTTVNQIEDVIKPHVEEESDFFMGIDDIKDLCPDVELEVGLVVTIGDDECEIVSISDTDIGLSTLSEGVVDEVVEENLSFDIGEPDILPSPQTMLRTKSSPVESTDEVKEEELSKEESEAIDKSIELMNAKVELTPEEIAINTAIESEIEDLYGSKLAFTYKVVGNQYNIQLESGETFILAAAYIESLKSEQ